MFKISSSGRNSCPQPKSPPINRLTNNRLSVNQTLPQLINISHRTLTDPLLQRCQYSVINRTEVRYAKKPEVGCYDEVRRLATKQLNGCACTLYTGALYCLNLSWFSAFDFIKKMKYAYDRKFLRHWQSKPMMNISSLIEMQRVCWYPRHHNRSFCSRSYTPFIAFWLLGPIGVTRRASVDQVIGSLGDTIFVAKLSRIRNYPGWGPNYSMAFFPFMNSDALENRWHVNGEF